MDEPGKTVRRDSAIIRTVALIAAAVGATNALAGFLTGDEPYPTAHPVAGVTAAVGLGLTVSRQLARLMSGDLTFRCENGESTFRLSLPVSS